MDYTSRLDKPQNEIDVDYHVFIHDRAICGWEVGEPDESITKADCPDCTQVLNRYMSQDRVSKLADWLVDPEHLAAYRQEGQTENRLRCLRGVTHFYLKYGEIWERVRYPRRFVGQPAPDVDLMGEYKRTAELMNNCYRGMLDELHTSNYAQFPISVTTLMEQNA